jgi:hypothetical protein
MRIDREDLRRHYESLSGEELLDVERSDLSQMAQDIYDQEMSRRGLNRPPEQKQKQEQEQEDGEAYHRPSPVFKTSDSWDFASQLGPDAGDGPPPAWLEDAACPWSAYIHPASDYIGAGAEVQAALREAGIPNRIVVKPPEPEPPSTPRSLYCVMVPGEFGTRAWSVVERKVFNQQAEAVWRTQLHAFSDEELRTLDPEDFWGALLDKADRMKRAYLEEIASRKLEAAAR